MSILTHKNITFIPSVPQRMAFADEVRRTFARLKPDVVAVALPRPLKDWVTRGVLRLPRMSAVCYETENSESGEMFYLTIDPADPMMEGLRLAMEHEADIEFLADLDLARSGIALNHYDLPDDLMIERAGLDRFVGTLLPELAAASELASDRAADKHVAQRLAALAGKYERVLCVIGIEQFSAIKKLLERNSLAEPEEQDSVREKANAPDGVSIFLADVKKRSISRITREIPYLIYRHEQWRSERKLSRSMKFDKLAALLLGFKEAAEKYREKYKTEVGLTRFKALTQFSRNMALVQGRLQPDIVHAIIGAKSVVDGDYGAEVDELLCAYPPQEKGSDLPRFILKDGRGTFSHRSERYRMTPYFDEPEMEEIKIGLRRRPPPQMLQLWKERWGREFGMNSGMCSWPPEDELQEKFMAFMRARALEVVSRDKRQVVEFSTSLMDGIDIRETMRNWHTGKLFVHQTPQPQGQVGAVVMIFDDERMDRLYQWKSTLYAENQNESDISFYATPLGENVVGPRICRTEFGGLLSVFPANHIPDIWQFPGVDQLKNNAEVLLAGGIIFSDHKFIAYVANRSPSSQMRELANRYNRYIIYMPIQSISATQIKKIRKFHILDGYDVRNFAADYIFE